MMREKATEPDVYLVYIIYDRNNQTLVKIANNKKPVFEDQSKKNSKLVYFEKFDIKSKAMRKKNHLLKLSEEKRMMLIRKKNPELLNLIFALFD